MSRTRAPAHPRTIEAPRRAPYGIELLWSPSPVRGRRICPHRGIELIWGDDWGHPGGQPLYVGFTTRFPRRMGRHRSLAHWWCSTARITTEQFESEAAAAHAEGVAIFTERPQWNVHQELYHV